MISLGPTSDIIVTLFLAISQLIEPVPEAAVKQVEQRLSQESACTKAAAVEAAYQKNKCERIKNIRAKYKVKCQGLENDLGPLKAQCASEPTLIETLKFHPKPLQEYFKMDNQNLLSELHLICNALQDRALLDREKWQKGETANRDDFAGMLLILSKPEVQDMANKVLKEAADKQFIADDAYKILTALCHYNVDRKALATQVDFTSGVKFLQEVLAELPDVNELPEQHQASFVYDGQNQRIGEIFDKEFIDRNGQRFMSKVHRRRLAEPTEIPRLMYDAFTAIEDKRFRQHNGFDFESIKRLYYGGMQGGKQGGSTFTMQLVKNAFFDEDVEKERALGKRTLRRKIKELLMIPMVEHRYSKDEILAYYLNLIDLTPDAQGVRMASIDLFGKEDLSKLTLSEIALLAALPKGVSKYNPHRNPKEARLRRDTVLSVMADQGYITQAEKIAAQAQEISLAPKSGADRRRILSRYFTGHITNYFASLKKEHPRDPRWLRGGFDIKTAYDPALQEILTSALQNGLVRYEATTVRPKGGGQRLRWSPWIDETTGKNMNIEKLLQDEDGSAVSLSEIFFSLQNAHPYPETNWRMAVKLPRENRWTLENEVKVAVNEEDLRNFKGLKPYDLVLLDVDGRLAKAPVVQGAAVMMDIETGDVLALSGGFSSGPFGKFAQNNRATGSLREPGSTIKPLTYLYSLSKGAQPTQVIFNTQIRFPKTSNCPYTWSPKNYSNGGGATMSMRTALQNSVNRAIMNLFAERAGVKINRAGTDLSGANASDKLKLTQTLDEVYDLASHFGAYPPREDLKALGRDEPCFPFVLGGYETTPLNMAQAYAAIANGGLKRDAVFLKEVVKDGEPILIDRSAQRWSELQNYRSSLKYGFARAPEAYNAIDGINPAAVAQIRYMMQGILANGTATRISRWSHLIGGKTGTTNNSRDGWFVGFTNKVAVAIWVGYDNAKVYPNLGEGRTGGNVALPIFEELMEAYYKIYPERLEDPLPLPSEIPGLFRVKVDPESGRVYPPRAGVCQGPQSAIDEFIQEATAPDELRSNSCQ